MPPTRLALVLATAAYVLGIGAQTAFVFFLVPTYATAHGVADAQMLAYGVQALAATLVGMAAGRLADRVPRRRVIRFGWGLEAAGALVLALLPNPVSALVLGSALVGAGLSYGYVGFQSYLADLHQQRSMARAYGTTGAIAVLAGAAAPFLAGRVLAARGDAAAALLVAGLALLGLLLTFPLRPLARAERPPQAGPRIGFAAAALVSFDPRGARPLARGGAMPYLVALGVLGLGYGMSVPWMGPYLLERHGLTPDALGTMVAVATAVGAGSVWLAGWAGQRWGGALRLAMGTNGALALTLVAFTLAPSLALASTLFVLRHFFGNPTGSILNAGLVHEVDPSERGFAMGATNAAWNLPWAMGAFAGGALLDAWGSGVFLASGVFILLGPALALALDAQRRSRGSPGARPSSGST